MRKLLLYISTTALYLTACSQQEARFLFALVNRVTLVAETGYFKTRALNSRGSGDTGTIVLAGGYCRVALAPLATGLFMEKMFEQSYNTLPPSAYAQLEYRFFINTPSINGHWMPLPPRGGAAITVFPYGSLLCATILKPGQLLVIQFRKKNGTMPLQENAFFCQALAPQVRGYHLPTGRDSISARMKSAIVDSKTTALNGLLYPENGLLRVPAGKRLDIILYKSLNRDSCLRYRWYKTGFESRVPWISTGHFITVPSSETGNIYKLELAYAGAEAVPVVYTIEAMPAWYQQPVLRLLAAALGVVLLVAVPWLMYQRRLRKKQAYIKRLEGELVAAHKDLNPHFVFNALNSIEALVYHGEQEKAMAYLGNFSGILRDTLEQGNRVFVNLEVIEQQLENYLQIEQLRFGFTYTIFKDPAIDFSGAELPPMLLQPTVENAIKHGVAARGKHGHIIISFEKEDHHLLVKVKDNGNGQRHSHVRSTGMGMQLTRSRIHLLQQLYHTENICYTHNFSRNGGTVCFIFSDWLE